MDHLFKVKHGQTMGQRSWSASRVMFSTWVIFTISLFTKNICCRFPFWNFLGVTSCQLHMRHPLDIPPQKETWIIQNTHKYLDMICTKDANIHNFEFIRKHTKAKLPPDHQPSWPKFHQASSPGETCSENRQMERIGEIAIKKLFLTSGTRWILIILIVLWDRFGGVCFTDVWFPPFLDRSLEWNSVKETCRWSS